MDVTVVVGTYGEQSWYDLAWSRAIPSAQKLGVHGVHAHGTTLHGARNAGLAVVETEWVCFLDADDELAPNYFEHMSRATADMRAPAVSYISRGVPRAPRVPNVSGHTHQCTGECLPFGNWLIIGTVVRTELVKWVGGFHDYPWSEDWALWVRCWQAGGTIESVPRAVYRAHVMPGSRNRSPSRAAKLAAHQAIARANGLPVPA